MDLKKCGEKVEAAQQSVRNGTNSTTTTGLHLSRKDCIIECGGGLGDINWGDFSQNFGAWFLPWISLAFQIPFGGERTWNFYASSYCPRYSRNPPRSIGGHPKLLHDNWIPRSRSLLTSNYTFKHRLASQGIVGLQIPQHRGNTDGYIRIPPRPNPSVVIRRFTSLSHRPPAERPLLGIPSQRGEENQALVNPAGCGLHMGRVGRSSNNC